MIVGPGLVHLADHLLQLLVGHAFVHPGALPAAGQLGGEIGVHEQLEGLPFVQHRVGAAAHDDAVALFRQLAQDLVLHHEQLAHVVVEHGDMGKSVGKGETEIVQQALFQGIFHVVLVQGALFRHLADDLPVVIGHAQRVGQPFAHFPAAAAEFPAHSDYPHERDLLSLAFI